ncbi:coiled-coil domain-containing protein 22 homolog isoform X2 [Hydractinia symbiolongicarpus]|uniref:coiled-coil domain-containing protein 22 homolog isoform X2 n=1 Tax=Hydractinia symbiolongicarpus TaxID=13093 RepID=UPI00255158AD|nr:coiled-coil domain-containing protein 22 homolog isoform X2 [Hydractinia symbiolongicarpus]
MHIIVASMEEVDNIIIHSLQQIGCDISDDVMTLREFTVEMIVQAASKCLDHISEQYNIPSVLPPSMSARFRIGSSLAAACQELGFKGEIGYQTFLYANEHELRKILMFLIEKIPKETSDTNDEPLGSGVLLNNRIAAELKRQLSVPWTPAYCKKKNIQNLDNDEWFFQGTSSFHHINTCLLKYPVGISSEKISKEEQSAFDSIPFVTSQPTDQRDIYISLIEENKRLVTEEHEWENEWNQSGMATRLSKEEYKKQKREKLMKRIKQKIIANCQRNTNLKTGAVGLKDLLDSIAGRDSKKTGKGSRFTHAEKLQFAQDEEKVNAEIVSKQEEMNTTETEEERQKKKEEELKTLRDQLSELTQQFQNILLEKKQVTAQKQQVDEQSRSLETTNKEEEAAFRVKKKTFDLLPNAEENMSKLQKIIESSSQRLVNLNQQWEKHRAPLIEKYRQLKEESKSRTSEVETKIEQVRSLRDKMKSAADETRGKEELLKQLAAEFERMSKNVNRSSYTKRILEIVGNIKKQKEEIAKVLLDTKALQKDINFLTGKLDRTFTVTDELIFKDAKKDEFSRKAYKLLANLHEGFGSLVQTVEETGVIMREIRDLEEQVDNINENEINENLEKISSDLNQMKKENNENINRIKRKNR